jgi:signal transduction histidine kinase
MSCVRGSVRCAALAGLLLLAAAPAEAQSPVRHVLVLQSFNRGNMILDRFTGNLRVELDQRAEGPVNVVQVVVGPTGSVGAPEQAVVDFIGSTFADGPQPDLVVTVAGPAAVFARKYREQLFPDAPLLFAAVDEAYLRDAPLGEGDTAVAVVNDFPGLVDDILQLLPQTRQVFMVMGSGQVGKFWGEELENPFRRFHDRLTFVWSDDLSFSELLLRSAGLPDDSAILYLAFGTDAAGAAYADERVMADLHAAASAPLFAAHNVYLGAGIVGGRLMSIDDLSRRTAEAAIEILNGAPRVEMKPQLRDQPMFDWRELQRWGIPESRLPPGSAVLYRGPTLWSEYRATVLLGVGALAIQAFLIIVLLLERRARQRAELDSRRSLVLAADANRRETMSALTSSMAHELAQPLSSMIFNAQALREMATTNRATPDTIVEILSDIQTEGVLATQIIDRHRTMLRSRQLQKKAIDLHAVVNDSLALLAHDMTARQIDVTLNLSSNPCVISGDSVLLEQVLVNLAVNAMDALVETPPDRRRITISSTVTATDVEVSVRDTGPGLRADIIGTLFTPFVTTKSHGLGIGLTIARRIVDAHRGTIEARNNPEGGATFTVTFPRSEMPEALSESPVIASAATESPKV